MLSQHYKASNGLEVGLNHKLDSSILRISGMQTSRVVQTVPFSQENCSMHDF